MRPVDISDCKWPIPGVKKCCNLMKGCWQCEANGVFWCYMERMWKMWGLEPHEVRVNTDLSRLNDRLQSDYQLSGNLGMSSSHDPLHRCCQEVFFDILELFDFHDWYDNPFWNGHILHIVTKRPSPLLQVLDILDKRTRIWCSITTPDDEQSAAYLGHVEGPTVLNHALNTLWSSGFHDIGASFGPCFGGWRELSDESLLHYFRNKVAPLKMAQFEMMNHGDHGLDVLTMDEVRDLARMFKEAQPQCEVYLKDTPFKVGELVEVAT